MKKNEVLLVILLLFASCGGDEAEIKVINSQIDTVNGLAAFNIYASDTVWDEMKNYGDSIFFQYKNKTYTLLYFCYPQHSIPEFKSDGNFTIKQSSKEPNFIIAEYFDTSLVKAPVFIKYPFRYDEAKKYEERKK